MKMRETPGALKEKGATERWRSPTRPRCVKKLRRQNWLEHMLVRAEKMRSSGVPNQGSCPYRPLSQADFATVEKNALPPGQGGRASRWARKKATRGLAASLSFGVFGFAACSQMSPPAGVLSWNWLLVQSSYPLRYRPIGSAIPLCRWTIYPGSVVFPQRASLVAVKLPVDPSLRVSPSSRVLPSVA